ncbi:hypothetical protein C0989_012612, partial [Termitomyces sp. Mn162]
MRQAFVNDAANATGEEPHIPVSSPITIDRSSRQWEWEWDHLRTKPSPDMRPIPLPLGTPPTTDSALMAASPAATDSTFATADEELSPASPTKEGYEYHSHREDIVSSGRVRMPEPVIYTPTTPSQSTTSLASSLFTHTPSTSSLEDLRLTTPGHPVPEIEGYDSPAPQDDRIKMMRDVQVVVESSVPPLV